MVLTHFLFLGGMFHIFTDLRKYSPIFSTCNISRKVFRKNCNEQNQFFATHFKLFRKGFQKHHALEEEVHLNCVRNIFTLFYRIVSTVNHKKH